MSDLASEVTRIFAGAWTKRDGQKVPQATELSLAKNDAVELEGTVLYADLSGSTEMVDGYKAYFAAEVYKAYLYCAGTLIRYHGGVVTAYDGDRVMGVFIGDRKNTSAAKCALRINWAVQQVINPAIAVQYPNVSFRVRQVVGIDSSHLFVARTGVRGDNDLVWVGRAANYAAKLTELDGAPARITHRVYDVLAEEAKTSRNGKPMWTQGQWSAMNNLRIYSSNWTWSPDD